MAKVKCFDVVEMVVGEANKQFAPLWEMDDFKYDVLKNYCLAIDKIIEKFGGETIDVEVDDIKMCVYISVEFDEVVLENSGELFYKLADRSMCISFSQDTLDFVNVKFTFPSLWERP